MADLLEIATGAADKIRISPLTTTSRKVMVADPGNDTSYVLVTSDTSGTAIAATSAEINRVADASARIVTVTAAATALTLTVTQHGDRLILLNTNNATGCTVTLPAATGSGVKYHVINNVVQTQGSIVVTCNTTDEMVGVCKAFDSTAVTTQAESFVTTATSDKVTLNLTTTGGLGYDNLHIYDVASEIYSVNVEIFASGTVATPFSAT